MIKQYAEEQLQAMNAKQLCAVVDEYAKLYGVTRKALVPRASKDMLIDTVLECQESKGGGE